MAAFLSLPNESIIQVLKSCDPLMDLVALASSCKKIQAVYASNVHSIGSQVGRRDIPAFEDAVITSRATRIVIEHFDQGQFPPTPFPLGSLPISAQKLSLQDVNSLVAWSHYITCIEVMSLHKTRWGKYWYAWVRSAEESGEIPEKWPIWRERFHRSMYRFFLMAAALCRTYQEPLVQGANRLRDFLMSWDRRVNTRRPGHQALLTREEMDYLLTFPVFNFEAYETHESVYGALAEFFVRQTPREAQNQRFTALYPTDATPDDIDRTHASAVYAAVLQCLFSTLAFWDHRAVKYAYTAIKGNTHSGRTVKVVPLGSFYPEQISTPADARDAHHTDLFTKEIPPAKKANNLWKKQASYLHLILQLMQDPSGQPNVYDYDCPTPMPPLQVFQFIARKYLGLRIAEDACQIDGEYAAHEKLLQDPGMATVYTDDWPVEVPTFFDSVDGAGNYEAFFLGDDDE